MLYYGLQVGWYLPEVLTAIDRASTGSDDLNRYTENVIVELSKRFYNDSSPGAISAVQIASLMSNNATIVLDGLDDLLFCHF